ncbi:MAG: type II toxin-antitoxin system HicB family antitoxin [Chloroflexota bacterium]|nr:type II toxin-antitoxin system HicB family antitoxin [Chloroflexota bacterium]MDE2884911.1 type II toxin-antitoxin system HicB family antitoxin [Chloroflexota bacterium]
MKQVFTASICKEGDWYVAQALEADVASQGSSVEDALANLREALELHFEPPVATATPEVVRRAVCLPTTSRRRMACR